ncbi:hypothetical protein [Streptomyces cellulosae]|uniref:hypothetical protein n=1 Tax=Streptomyces cellulosae TaxID=1968 RepID=UPI000AC530EE
MTDATTGPGAEGAPRDGKTRGRAAFPATPPGHDPATDPPTESRRGEPGTEADAASGADPTRGREPGTADDTARGGPTAPFGGETFPGRETAPDDAAGRSTGGASARGRAQGGTEPGADPTRGREPAPGGDTARGGAGPLGGEPRTGREAGTGGETGRAGGLGGETAAGRDSVPETAGTRDDRAATTPDLATTRDPAGTHPRGDSAAARGREATGAEDGAGAHGSRLLPRDECDKLAQELQHAVAGFVDGPRDSVAEADHVLEEAAARFTEAVTQRRRTLRRSWQTTDGGAEGKPATSADTEQLRLALRDYRELADRLLHL